MNKKLEKAFDRFFSHFHYWPKSPQNIDFDQEQYANLFYRKQKYTETIAECFSVKDENVIAKDLIGLLEKEVGSR